MSFADLTTLRAKIPALQDCLYLNTGTFGPMPKVVVDEIRHGLDLMETHGPYSPLVRQTVEREGYEWTRKEAAALLGVSADEIVLTSNASTGINLVAHGLDWRPGDEVVISEQEHQSGMLPWLMLQRRNGIKVRVARLADDPGTILQNFADQMTPQTRLVFASHVSCVSGMRLPVCEIGRLARDKGKLFAVDGSHALGQFPIHVPEIGCDAYIGCGHKWLLGPQGTSFTYVKQEHQQTFQPSWLGWGAEQDLSIDPFTGAFLLYPSGRQYEFGTKQWMLFPGLGRAIQFVNEVGIEAIQTHVEPLARQLKQTVDEVPHWQRLTPMRPESSAGLVSIRLHGKVPPDTKELLWERHRLLVAFNAADNWLRLSVAFFTTEAEIARAIEAILALDG